MNYPGQYYVVALNIARLSRAAYVSPSSGVDEGRGAQDKIGDRPQKELGPVPNFNRTKSNKSRIYTVYDLKILIHREEIL
jgi:hypothetical protein